MQRRRERLIHELDETIRSDPELLLLRDDVFLMLEEHTRRIVDGSPVTERLPEFLANCKKNGLADTKCQFLKQRMIQILRSTQ